MGENNPIGIILVIIAIVVALVFFSNILVWIAILAGAVILGVVILIIVSGAKKKKEMQREVSPGVTQGQITQYMVIQQKRMQDIRRYYYRLGQYNMRETLDEITQGVKDVLKILREDPSDYTVVRRFLNATLASLENIVHQAAHLSAKPEPDQVTIDALRNAADGMEMIRDAIQHQIEKLYENNIINLDVEIEVLRRSLSAKGLIDAPQSRPHEKEIEDEQ